MKIKVRDPIIKKVIKKFIGRSNVGFKKYKVTLQDDSGDMDTWLNHLQEELMDAVNYIEKARQKLDEDKIQLIILKGQLEAQKWDWSTSINPHVQDFTVVKTCNCILGKDGKCCQKPISNFLECTCGFEYTAPCPMHTGTMTYTSTSTTKTDEEEK